MGYITIGGRFILNSWIVFCYTSINFFILFELFDLCLESTKLPEKLNSNIVPCHWMRLVGTKKFLKEAFLMISLLSSKFVAILSLFSASYHNTVFTSTFGNSDIKYCIKFLRLQVTGPISSSGFGLLLFPILFCWVLLHVARCLFWQTKPQNFKITKISKILFS